MEPNRVPVALRARLGEEAAIGLIELLQSTGRAWSEEVLNLAVERFERRLTEEISRLRVEIAQAHASLQTSLRQDIAAVRVELLKWSFLFWVGQVAAMAGLLAFMLPAFAR